MSSAFSNFTVKTFTKENVIFVKVNKFSILSNSLLTYTILCSIILLAQHLVLLNTAKITLNFDGEGVRK